MFSVLTITLDSFLPSIVPPSCYSLAEYQNGIASDAGRLMNVVYNYNLGYNSVCLLNDSRLPAASGSLP